ncbi:MAG: right-handed parallel beta-helix repeat-containing protein [Nitrospirae bacterium]|nr:right-handed parallel beta-helix repeat-containing protein [Nitrospirota bacterium]
MRKLTGWITTVLFFVLVGATGADAQATRTWISGVGDDANPCSRTAPCKTFAGAISKTAAKGEINVLDPGGFGAVTITKAMTIDGSGGSIAGISAAGTNGIVVNAGATDAVVLRNLDIDGMGTGLNGIRFIAGKSLRVENSKIFGFTQYGIDFEPGGESTFAVEKTVVHDSALGGLYVKPGAAGSASGTVTGSNFSNNTQFGVKVEDKSKVMIIRSVADNNAGDGYIALSTSQPSEITLTGSVASGNTSGGVVASGSLAVVYMSGTTVTQNGTGIVSISGGDVLSASNNSIVGNTADGAPTGYLPLYSGPLVIY